MKKEAYIAINPETRQVLMVCGIEPSNAKSVSNAIKKGYIIDRVNKDKARNLFMKFIPERIEL